jgi:hypothetical protein
MYYVKEPFEVSYSQKGTHKPYHVLRPGERVSIAPRHTGYRVYFSKVNEDGRVLDLSGIYEGDDLLDFLSTKNIFVDMEC